MNGKDDNEAKHDMLRSCTFAYVRDSMWDGRRLKHIRKVQPSLAEVDFIRKAMDFGRRLLTLRQAARCVAQKLVKDPDEQIIQTIRESLVKQLSDCSVAVVLTVGMFPYTFGAGFDRLPEGDALGENVIVVNYEVSHLEQAAG